MEYSDPCNFQNLWSGVPAHTTTEEEGVRGKILQISNKDDATDQPCAFALQNIIGIQIWWQQKAGLLL
jgi:hypothetical protein